MGNNTPTDPLENIKHFFVPLIEFLLQSYQIIIVVVGVGFILLLLFFIFFEKLLGF